MNKICKNFDFPFFKKSLKILVPIVLSSIILVAVGFVDTIMVNGYNRPGQPKKIDYEAVVVVGELWFAFQAFFSATIILFGILYSQFANNQKIFTETAKFNSVFSLVVTITISAIMFFAAEPLINIFFMNKPGVNSDLVKKIAYNYFKILSIGQIFVSLSQSMLNPLTIKGKANYILLLSIFSIIINFILDYIFIYIFNMGAEGSGWATVISYGSQFLITIWLVARHKKWFSGFFQSLKLNGFVIKEIFKRTWVFLSFILMQMGFGFSTALLVNLYGSDYLKAMGVGYIVSSIMFTVFAGTNRGVKIFVGPLLGQEKYKEAKIIAKKLWYTNVFIAFILLIFALISSSFFPNLMLDKKSDIRIARYMILIYASAYPAYISCSYFSSVLETSGFQLVPNIWNYFFQVWWIMPLSISLSYLWLDLSFLWNFAITQFTCYFGTYIIFIIYKKNKWLRRIEVTDKTVA